MHRGGGVAVGEQFAHLVAECGERSPGCWHRCEIELDVEPRDLDRGAGIVEHLEHVGVAGAGPVVRPDDRHFELGAERGGPFAEAGFVADPAEMRHLIHEAPGEPLVIVLAECVLRDRDRHDPLLRLGASAPPCG